MISLRCVGEQCRWPAGAAHMNLQNRRKCPQGSSYKITRVIGVRVVYCIRHSCQREKPSLRCDSVFNRDSDSHSGASALVLVVVTIKDTVTTQAKGLSRWHSSCWNKPFVPGVTRGDFLQYLPVLPYLGLHVRTTQGAKRFSQNILPLIYLLLLSVD